MPPPNIADGAGLRPLWYAVSYGHLEIINALLKNGLDLNLTNEYSKRTILHKAVSSSATEIGAIILAPLKHGADPLAIDDHGMTAWHAAAASGNLKVLEVLTQHMQRTKNLEIRNKQRETALFLVVKSGSLCNTQFLLHSGICVTLHCNDVERGQARGIGYVNATTRLKQHVHDVLFQQDYR